MSNKFASVIANHAMLAAASRVREERLLDEGEALHDAVRDQAVDFLASLGYTPEMFKEDDTLAMAQSLIEVGLILAELEKPAPSTLDYGLVWWHRDITISAESKQVGIEDLPEGWYVISVVKDTDRLNWYGPYPDVLEARKNLGHHMRIVKL